MACIIHIETSTTVCSVALSVDGNVVFERISFEGTSHAALLGVYIEEAISFSREKHFKPEAVALSGGPGSYTGLRIGTSIAKGLCMGWDIPLIAVPTLQLMASQAIRKYGKKDCLYCAMLDARRMEVYSAIYDANLLPVRTTNADIVTPDLFQAYLNQGIVCFFGNGAAKCRTIITSGRAVFLDNIHPEAADMATMAEQAFQAKKFENTAYFEPFYLKEFMATVPKNKLSNIQPKSSN
ncbi:MAG: tRNA (adenosine(37)-N6)-threonylcarbamoyltransferase complex dimerization subunit type 1 TsaB [Tannerella sp.]|nr:tRNA (adenosine(37)-N6)-threonylcarbamoyltransferase complex dimerization subunit type 1 TsaB [Tannerella sp.]